MPVLEPDDNKGNNNASKDLLPDLASVQNRTLTLEEQFQLQNFTRAIERSGDIDQIKSVTQKLISYYFHSQNLIKTLALENLEKEMSKEDKIQTIAKAKKIISEAKKDLGDVK